VNEQHTGCGVRIAIVRAREKKSAIFHELRYPLPIPHMDVVARRAAVARHLLQSCSFAHYVTSSSSVHLSMYYNTSGERGDILLFLLQLLSFLQSNCPCTQCTLRTKTKDSSTPVCHMHCASFRQCCLCNFCKSYPPCTRTLSNTRASLSSSSFFLFPLPPKKDSSPWVECTHPDTGSPNRPSHTFGQPQGGSRTFTQPMT